MKVVILAGGKSVRMNAPGESFRSKPLVEIAGRPLISWVVDQLLTGGATEIIVATGKNHTGLTTALNHFPDHLVRTIFTGENSGTAWRLKLLGSYLSARPYITTYCDILTDVNIAEMWAEHHRNATKATVLAVPYRLPYGQLTLSERNVVEMREKPILNGIWVNGGYFVFDPHLFDAVNDANEMIEQAILPRLALARELSAWRYSGEWIPVDTEKDRERQRKL